ncbi:MAG TPA: FAD-dependent thymidylate synthase [Solirubrobacteraceae bacterium]
MHETKPQVFLLARPSLDLDGMRAYLADVGGESWLERRLEETQGETNGGELIVEFGGRACYRSWEPGLNPNVTRVRTDQREYFANILRSAHGSVLEHANYSFAIRNCSRVFTHELVRHRAGSAFSQESLRYVRLTDIVWSANARTLRHVIEMRTAEGAEEELRLVFDKIARLMLAEAPNLFQDFVRHDDGSWVPENRKV